MVNYMENSKKENEVKLLVIATAHAVALFITVYLFLLRDDLVSILVSYEEFGLMVIPLKLALSFITFQFSTIIVTIGICLLYFRTLPKKKSDLDDSFSNSLANPNLDDEY